MSFPKPTDREWELILSKVPNKDGINREDIGVVRHRMADNDITSYNSVLSDNLMGQFRQDMVNGRGGRGVPLQLNHETYKMLPLGRSFDAKIKEEEGKKTSDGRAYKALYGSFYVVQSGNELAPSGSMLGGGISFDMESLAKKYSAGILAAGSVGFSVKKAECSICGQHPFSDDCEHAPGKKYDGKTCYTLLGNVKKNPGALREYSLVTSGAVEQAEIVENYNYSEEEPSKTHSLFFDIEPEREDTPVEGELKVTSSDSDSKNDVVLKVPVEWGEPKKAHSIPMVTPEPSAESDYIKQLAQAQVQLTFSQAREEEYKKELDRVIKLNNELTEKLNKFESFDEREKVLDEFQAAIVEEIKGLHVKANGQCPDEELEKYDSMTITELSEARESLAKAFVTTFIKSRKTQLPENKRHAAKADDNIKARAEAAAATVCGKYRR